MRQLFRVTDTTGALIGFTVATSQEQAVEQLALRWPFAAAARPVKPDAAARRAAHFKEKVPCFK